MFIPLALENKEKPLCIAFPWVVPLPEKTHTPSTEKFVGGRECANVLDFYWMSRVGKGGGDEAFSGSSIGEGYVPG